MSQDVRHILAEYGAHLFYPKNKLRTIGICFIINVIISATPYSNRITNRLTINGRTPC